MDKLDRPRILCVDDEPHVLDGLARVLRHDFVVVSAAGGVVGLESIASEGPFAVIVSDMRMPGMDGATFLRQARERVPDTTRILLTGHADQDAAINAVNEGSVFRFLTKPCPANVLIAALKAGAEQYRLVNSERVLLERTLLGSIKALTDILAIVNPTAFGRAQRVRGHVVELATRHDVPNRWQIEAAASLSEIGSITLPPDLADKLYHGQNLTPDEEALVARGPIVAKEILGDIPRLDPVIDIIAYQNKHFDGGGTPRDDVRGGAIPWGSRALRVVLDFDALEARGLSVTGAIDVLRQRTGWYDPDILESFAFSRGVRAPDSDVREIRLREVRPGMTFAEDVKTRAGTLLIARGQDVTPGLAERLRLLPPQVTVVEPIRVLVRYEAERPALAVAGGRLGWK